MSRLVIPARDEVPEASKPILDVVHKQLGVVPNMFRLIAQSPAALQGFTSNNAALAKTLDRPVSGSPLSSPKRTHATTACRRIPISA